MYTKRSEVISSCVDSSSDISMFGGIRDAIYCGITIYNEFCKYRNKNYLY